MTGRGSVLVTGATGFIGSHVCAGLVAAGWAVRALVRAPAARVPAGVEVHVAQLDDPVALCRATDGMSAVVHCAGRAHVVREPAAQAAVAYRQVNLDGTIAVARAALAAGVQRFVFVSSVAAGAALPGPTGPASSTPRTQYGRSKLEAEAALQELAAGSSMRASVVRPPMVYGPGMRGNPRRLFDWLDRGWPLPFGAIANRRTSAYVGNVVAGVEALLDAREAAAGVYFVGDAEALSTPEFAARAARALGRVPRFVPVPVPLLRALAAIGDVLRPWFPVPLTSETVGSLCGSLVLDTAPLARATGFRPPVSIDQGLRATAEWYRKEHGGAA